MAVTVTAVMVTSAAGLFGCPLMTLFIPCPTGNKLRNEIKEK